MVWACRGDSGTPNVDPASDDQGALAGAASEPRAWRYLLAVSLAVIGGVLGIGGAFFEELRVGGGIFVAFLAAPVIEEALKPTGIYIALIRWPHMIRGQVYTAALTALAGLTFGIIESIVYVTVYASGPPDWFVTYRFTVTLAVHAAASFLVGLGLNRGVIDWARGQAPLPKVSRNFYIAGVALHAVYNTAVVALSLAGVFDLG